MIEVIALFLCGDVMLGRGIDQALPHSCAPQLHEAYVRDARRYVALAEEENGEIPAPVDYDYVWGEALKELKRRSPDAGIINLETSVTTSDDAWPRKGIHYRMHPKNVRAITAAEVDCCVLANNHVLDWGEDGLNETLTALREAELKVAGAGENRRAALRPAVIEVGQQHRVLVFGMGWKSSGIPDRWAAGEEAAGVNLMGPDDESVEALRRRIEEERRSGDIVVVSVHWGGNWGYEIPSRQKRFAHRLVDGAGVDVVHGHSSHHVKGLEIYRDRLILYGCGDFITDYEGISGKERYRPSVSLMHFPQLDPESGRLVRLEMVPTRIERFRVRRAPKGDARWLEKLLRRECKPFDVKVKLREDGILEAKSAKR